VLRNELGLGNPHFGCGLAQCAMAEPDGSAPLIARVDLGAASDDNVTRTMAADLPP
jgi:hypothetical protein